MRPSADFEGAHGDVHDVWIDPTNPQTVFAGDDGGMWYSYNGGSKWWKADNLPISQFYHVSVDDADPYHVYGGLQDNSCWVGDSQYPGGITNAQWENMYGGDGFWMFPDPADPDYLYAESQGGTVGRVNRHTHEARDIQPKPNYKEKLRFNWNTPIALSPNEKGTIYIGAQFLFRSRDHGQTWDRISPDLTTNDPEKQKQEQSGGVTVDNSAAEMHTTIYSISESPKDTDLIWVGTDDGNLQLTRDGGKTWTNVVGNVPGLPKNSWVSWVQASNFDAGHGLRRLRSPHLRRLRALRFPDDRFRQDLDAAGHGRRTPKACEGYAHVIKEDLVQPNLLFLGTEFGLYISIDGGKTWAQFKGSHFPAVAVRDLAIQPRDNDLVLATHGRGIWIIDDITPLRALTPELLDAGSRFRLRATRAAADRRQRRLGERRRGFHRRQSARRRGHHLLPAVAPSFRQTEDRSARLHRAAWSTNCPRANGPDSIASPGACAKSRRASRPPRKSPSPARAARAFCRASTRCA